MSKHDSTGALVWAKRAGGSTSGAGQGVSVQADGSAVVIGDFQGTVVFGLGEVGETTLVSAGNSDVFVARFAANGNLVWAKRAGGASFSYGRGISVATDGSAIAVGSFMGTAIFGPGEVGETSLTSAGGSDVFVARYNSDGSLAWVKQAGGPASDLSQGVSVDSGGLAAVTGRFSGTAIFGAGEAGETSLVSAGVDDIFVAKYNSNGTLAWAKRAGGLNYDSAQGVSMAGDGSTTVTGKFQDTAVFGPGETWQTSLISSGANDIFVAHYNADGTLAWAKRSGGTGQDYGNEISLASDGSAMVAGSFYGTAVFGSGEVGETTLVSDGFYDDFFVAKYNTDGTLAWARRGGGPSYDYGYGVSVNLADGSAITTGTFRENGVFGAGEPGEATLGPGGVEIFVAKYNADGTLSWASQGTTSGRGDEGRGISSLSGGSAVVTGTFNGNILFDATGPGTTTLTSVGGSDVFIAKYNANNSLAWAKRAGGPSLEGSNGAATAADGSAVITGYFYGTAIFGAGEPGETSITAQNSDIFVARYNPDGTLAWAKRAGGPSFHEGRAVAIASDGSALVTGTFLASARFGIGEPGETLLTSAGALDIFVAKYNLDGTLAWAKSAGGTTSDYGRGISITSNDSAIISGDFQGTAVFGLGETGETSLISAGGSDIFLARYNAAGTFVGARRAGGSSDDHSNGVAVAPDNTINLIGDFQGTAIFGLGEAGETSLTSAGAMDAFVAKYNANGTVAWAKRGGGSSSDVGRGISVVSDGSATVTGDFQATAIFGLGEGGETALVSAGGSDIFVIRYNPDGTLAWAKRAGGPLSDVGRGLSVASDGSTNVTGDFQGKSIFGPGEPVETSLTSAAGTDLFVAKYSL